MKTRSLAPDDPRERLRLTKMDDPERIDGTSFAEWCEANGYDPRTRTYVRQ